ncbi:MAG: ATP-binding cassette domain-containing protein [Nitrospirae bacterium]|nr:MAG: ATP-binding cassette domain-containing protein [Nitrospirota bacterium]
MSYQDEIIRTDSLTRYFTVKKGLFGKRAVIRAVEDVSIVLPRDRVLSVVGESGSGKSTLARLVLRLIEPTSGRVYFKGKDISTFTRQQMKAFRRSVQVVFQDPFASLNPRQSIYSALSEPFKVHGLVRRQSQLKERVAELLLSVGLRPEHMNRYPHEFSGGQRQRICIARALSLRPEVIVADEPLSSLDVSIQAQILNLLTELKQKHSLSYLFISHDLNVVRFFSDYVAVMYAGSVVEEAETEELFVNPLHPYTELLIESAPGKGRKKRLALQAVNEVTPTTNRGCAFYDRCSRRKDHCKARRPQLIERKGRKVACFEVK